MERSGGHANRLPSNGGAWSAPLHGTVDRATRPSGSRFFFDTVGSKDKTLKLYEGHYHDLLNDIGKEGVLAEIRSWIEKRLPARAG